MSNIILEEIIRSYLTEQSADMKKTVISKLSRRRQADVRTGNALNGFDIKLKYRGAKPTTLDVDLIRRQIQADTQYGNAGTIYDKLDAKNGNFPMIAYVVSNDISDKRNVSKYIVWIVRYSVLMNLATKISEKMQQQQSTSYSGRVVDIPERKLFNVGNAMVFSYKDFNTWLQQLKQLSEQYKIPLVDGRTNQPYKWLDLDAMNTPDTAEEESTEITPETVKMVKVDVDNSGKYGLTNYAGNVEIQTLPNGKLTAMPVGYGMIDVNRENDGVLGTFTGEFKNGMPASGKITWDDGTIWEGQFESKLTYEEDGSKNFTFKQPIAQTKPYVLKKDEKGVSIVTISDSDPYVYAFVNGKWFSLSKTDYNNKQTNNQQEVTNPEAINKLNAAFPEIIKNLITVDTLTPIENNDNSKIKIIQTKKPVIKKQTTTTSTTKLGKSYGVIGKEIPLYRYNTKSGYVNTNDPYVPDPGEKFIVEALSQDKNYAYGVFNKDADKRKTWIKVSNLKK